MTSWDIATSTSLLTGTAKVEINGGQPLTKPTQAQTLIEVVPYMSSIGALTAGQTYLTKCIIESNSINLLPKQFIVPPIVGGLGTFTTSLTQPTTFLSDFYNRCEMESADFNRCSCTSRTT